MRRIWIGREHWGYTREKKIQHEGMRYNRMKETIRYEKYIYIGLPNVWYQFWGKLERSKMEEEFKGWMRPLEFDAFEILESV